jgi:cellulose synthase operon protein C
VCDELRTELARMHLARGEADPAIQLLSAAVDKNPPQPQLEFLRVGLGHAYLAKGDTNAALGHAQTALADSNHPVRAAAYLLKGMALLQAKNPGEAQSVLTRFVSGAEKYVNAGPVTEEGLFRLGQAYAASNQWAASREAFERLLSRFGGSRFAPDARFGIALAFQQEKQFDRAADAFADVTRKSTGELAARAQMQLGLCRAEQKRWKEAAAELLAVPATYDYAEFNAQSSLAAASALRELKDTAKAKEVLQRIVADHPETAWATEAAKRIKEIQ